MFSTLNNRLSAKQWSLKHNGTSCLCFLLIFHAFTRENWGNIFPFRPKTISHWSMMLLFCTTCASTTHVQICISLDCLSLRSTDKKYRPVSTSPKTTGSTEVQLVRDVINYTYIDRNCIHYSWTSQRQSYFPPSQNDEKILNNSTRLQTSAFHRRRLTLKRLIVGAADLEGNHGLGPTCFKLSVVSRVQIIHS